MRLANIYKLPPPPSPRVLLCRGAYLWAGVQLIIRMPPLGIAPTFFSRLSPPISTAIITIAAILALIETRRRNEHLLLANLGSSQVVIFTLLLTGGIIGQLVLSIAL